MSEHDYKKELMGKIADLAILIKERRALIDHARTAIKREHDHIEDIRKTLHQKASHLLQISTDADEAERHVNDAQASVDAMLNIVKSIEGVDKTHDAPNTAASHDPTIIDVYRKQHLN